MTNEEIKKKKDELMLEHWTEDLHHSLQDFHPDVAKKIIDSMSNSEIYVKVNHRQFQADYIADYLEYLWEISESAFWKHVVISLDTEVGLLWSDNMYHFEKMCKTRIPKNVLEAVIVFFIDCEKYILQDIEAIGCVLKAQVEKFNRLEEIHSYIKSLKLKDEKSVIEQVEELIKNDANYNFY